ncbi:hypothetical protein [Staphylococcus pseudintermedius]|uniref:hypothetical protein n=1 Tax=Staphylococcus pseudintermedius TaxID=283734 RepID=UPI0018F583DD|nr:hypothetical protein [Staphylococcus pseudintermedius]EGQ4408749.1 hypothetical protein [Staphylococcus pseudintermedius]EHT3695468.1 hypothetical protein [Staphylococcus pseudintermedius]EIK0255470.1 hypothetical protein [Staphylococcus pseudintermedius]ELJ9215812.1 hypothetical protein [Staphylococcus pseudintermedius]MBJ8281695.1 hypothetical protein [Staphylococcus pseudintermedius]
MARLTKEVSEVVCDICGNKADGEFYELTYLNGEVYAEIYCPIDLCKHHMKVFASQFSHYAYERHGGNSDTEELIIKMKNYDEEHAYDNL